MKTTLRLLTLLLLLTSTLHAQVPQIISYQGRVAVGTTNFNGSGAFKFALVNADGTTTYWSNDGTSNAGSQPTAAVTLTVTKGLYSVLLGDTSLTNMSAVPAAVFTNADVRLRVWFNDGANGFQLLTPDQRLAAVGYAMIAAGVSLPVTTSATTGVITQNGAPLLHSFGPGNFFAGFGAGNFTMTGSQNTASGFYSLQNNTTGFRNTASGFLALGYNTTGSNNTASGFQALLDNTTGSNNTASGFLALLGNTTGGNNTASGFSVLRSNTTGIDNTGAGSNALFANTTGSRNMASGTGALSNNTTGSNNIALGNNAGLNINGNNNIAIGNTGVAGDFDTIRLGTGGTQTRAFIAGTFGSLTGLGAVQVLIDSTGQLGTISSSRRYKEDIADMGEASARLHALRPVTFHYKAPYANGEKPVQFGLIAEEVAEVFPELAVFNKEGQPETVKYQDLTPLLLNEVQKVTVEKDELKRQLAETNARLSRLESLLPASPAPTASNSKGD